MIDFVKNIFRPIKNILFTIVFSVYDFYRFSRYSGMFKRDRIQRDFRLIKIYHTLEKSLSFRKQKKGAAKSVVNLLRMYLGLNIKAKSFNEKVATDVLFEFNTNEIASIEKENRASLGGAIPYSDELMKNGLLDSPEDFFYSRYSIREFDGNRVESAKIIRALELASKTPSSCNRQPWFTYYLDDKALIGKVLGIQGGANGFGETISTLVVISVDQRAYDTAVERYQGWIDGGMYGMSFIYACHSLGLGTCCLNWAKNISDERSLRRLVPIKKEHSVLMMVGIGIPFSEFKVCLSKRTPVSDKYKYIQ